MAAKQLLPALGGSSAVWITCLVFFQTALLLGYLYAHWLGRRSPRTTSVLHIALLVLAVVALALCAATGSEPRLRTSADCDLPAHSR